MDRWWTDVGSMLCLVKDIFFSLATIHTLCSLCVQLPTKGFLWLALSVLDLPRR